MTSPSARAVQPLFAVVIAKAILAATILVAAAAAVTPAHAFVMRPGVIAAVGKAAAAPSGWVQFCRDHEDACRPTGEATPIVELTDDRLAELYAINRFVAERVRWSSDLQLYGKLERWEYPLDRGDCEDIALEKRRLLMRSGWPASTLLMTVVHEGPGRPDVANHAVLTVRTDHGDLVLDNQSPEILHWHETPYRFLKRQSPDDPNVWVSLSAPTTEHADAAVAAPERRP